MQPELPRAGRFFGLNLPVRAVAIESGFQSEPNKLFGARVFSLANFIAPHKMPGAKLQLISLGRS
jgi:hypothetical protein